MRNIKMIRNSLIAFMIVALWSCNYDRMSELEQKNSELTSQLVEMDSSMNAYLQTISEIEDNLVEIKEKQNIISSASDLEFSEGVRKSLVSDLQAINDLMNQNRKQINYLEESLRNSNFQVAEFQKLLARLNKKLVEKDKEIRSLSSELTEVVSKNLELNDNLKFLAIKIDTLSTVNKVQQETINEQNKLIARNLNELSSGFVATGTLKELEQKEIIKKEGGILGLGAVARLNDEIDKDNFLRIDINKTQTIPLMVKRVKVITNHPLDSYKIEESENGDLLANLVITNPERFWNTSKFLVVRVN